MTFTILLLGCTEFGLTDMPSREDLAAPEVGALEGRTWSVDLAHAEFVEPAGLGGLLSDDDDMELLFHTTEERDDGFDMLVTLADGDGGQDPCERVVELPAAVWTGGAEFAVGGSALEIPINSEAITLSDLELAGVLSEDATAWEDGELHGLVDTRELAGALGDLDYDGICELIELAKGSCGPCEDGVEACFELHLADLYGEERSLDFEADPVCE